MRLPSDTMQDGEFYWIRDKRGIEFKGVWQVAKVSKCCGSNRDCYGNYFDYDYSGLDTCGSDEGCGIPSEFIEWKGPIPPPNP